MRDQEQERVEDYRRWLREREELQRNDSLNSLIIPTVVAILASLGALFLFGVI